VLPLDPEQLDARNMLGVIYFGWETRTARSRNGVSYFFPWFSE
jgi:hypothetical protein